MYPLAPTFTALDLKFSSDGYVEFMGVVLIPKGDAFVFAALLSGFREMLVQQSGPEKTDRVIEQARKILNPDFLEPDEILHVHMLLQVWVVAHAPYDKIGMPRISAALMDELKRIIEKFPQG